MYLFFQGQWFLRYKLSTLLQGRLVSVRTPSLASDNANPRQSESRSAALAIQVTSELEEILFLLHFILFALLLSYRVKMEIFPHCPALLPKSVCLSKAAHLERKSTAKSQA